MTFKKGLCALLVTGILLGTPAHGTEVTSSKTIFVAQTKSVKYRCFPAKLQGIIRFIQRETKRKVIITSGHRTYGRKGSMHRSCRAADIRVPGVSMRRLKAVARRAPNIGGIGTYRGKPGLLHVDVGPRREWTY